MYNGVFGVEYVHFVCTYLHTQLQLYLAYGRNSCTLTYMHCTKVSVFKNNSKVEM